jgi:hypothetical protein
MFLDIQKHYQVNFGLVFAPFKPVKNFMSSNVSLFFNRLKTAKKRFI